MSWIASISSIVMEMMARSLPSGIIFLILMSVMFIIGFSFCDDQKPVPFSAGKVIDKNYDRQPLRDNGVEQEDYVSILLYS